MANLGQKDGIYHIRFRGREYKRSLKIRDRVNAEGAKNLVELTIHRLLTGQIAVEQGVDLGDFIVSGGTLAEPVPDDQPSLLALPTTTELIEDYNQSQKNLLAKSYHDSQAMHLRHLLKHLGDLANVPCDQIGHREIDRYLKMRLAERHPNTAERERITIMQFFK